VLALGFLGCSFTLCFCQSLGSESFGVQYLVVPLSKISIFLGPSTFPVFNFNLRLNSNSFCSIRGFSRLNLPLFVSHQGMHGKKFLFLIYFPIGFRSHLFFFFFFFFFFVVLKTWVWLIFD